MKPVIPSVSHPTGHQNHRTRARLSDSTHRTRSAPNHYEFPPHRTNCEPRTSSRTNGRTSPRSQNGLTDGIPPIYGQSSLNYAQYVFLACQERSPKLLHYYILIILYRTEPPEPGPTWETLGNVYKTDSPTTYLSDQGSSDPYNFSLSGEQPRLTLTYLQSNSTPL